MSRYRIPKQTTRTEIRVSNSRFITTVARADSATDAQDFIRRINSEMPDASHHVYAFKIGYGGSVQEGMSDAGEPSGTSGPPTLAVLRGADVGDTVLVTTRYFGGTKLGTGGLVAAYTQAAQTALAATSFEDKVTRLKRQATIPYPLHEKIRRLLPEYEAEILDESFGGEVTIVLQVPEERCAGLTEAVTNLSAGRVRLASVD